MKNSIKKSDVDNVLEIYYNESTNYDEIADRCNLSILDVANIVNEEIRIQIIKEEQKSI